VFPKSVTRLAIAAALALAACGRKPVSPPDASAPSPGAAFAASPAVTLVKAGPQGVNLSGTAAPAARVRLAPPGGVAQFATADAAGRWRLGLPPLAQPAIFGLSETVGGRQVQGEGYVLVSPDGKAALLRAGTGAVRLDPLRSPALTAVDFDADGGAVISGLAPADSTVFLKLDGRQIAQARTDAAGRYALTLTQPLPRGPHALEVAGDAFSNPGQVEVSRPQPLVAGPLRSQFVRGGLRIDWLTPGGGVQSTVLLD
jgi:hypothetical protein